MRVQFWLENLTGTDHLGDCFIGGRMILKWILRKELSGCGLDRDRGLGGLW